MLQYIAAGCLAVEVQRKANNIKVNNMVISNTALSTYTFDLFILLQTDHYSYGAECFQSAFWICCSAGQ